MAYDLNGALAQLADLVKGPYTQADLLNLVRQVDIAAEGEVTVLYSGRVNGTSTSELASEMRNNPNVRVIDKTAAADFLQSREFLAALGRTNGVSADDMLNTSFSNPAKQALLDWLYDGKSGPWAETSGRFVDATSGKVRILTESPRGGSVLLQNAANDDELGFRPIHDEQVQSPYIT